MTIISFDGAVALDPTFGLARVCAAEAAVARGYPLKQSEIDRGVADAANANARIEINAKRGDGARA